MKRKKLNWNICGFLGSLLLGVLWAFSGVSFSTTFFDDLFVAMFAGSLLGGFFIYPFGLTLLNLSYFFRKPELPVKGAERKTEIITLTLGIIYTLLYDTMNSSSTSGIQFRSDWEEILNIGQFHTPIWTKAGLTIAAIAFVGILGYMLLSLRDINNLPPLVTVCGIAAIYLGMLMCILWVVQLFPKQFLMCLFPINCIILGTKRIWHTVVEWQSGQDGRCRMFKNSFLNRINGLLMDASRWPVAAFLLMWPLLGVLIIILVLFGQQPDSVIRAWTETSDWNLSQRVAPPSVSFDAHYLCTVAAQGHPKVVKPLRLGVRHGHEVIVNRQLCIANAFEQILEERVPTVHRIIRNFYDRYGFPVAKLIRSSFGADVIYILMKPLEWLFLIILYLVDAAPENRIAVQYPHKTVPDFL